MSDMDRQHVTDSLDAPITAAPGAASLNDMLHKDGSLTYDNTTDSLEAISDALTALNVDDFSTTDGGTIVQDSAMGTGTPDVLSVSSSGTANTFGSWVEVDASTAADVWISHITINKATATDSASAVEVGTGAGASEVAKIRLGMYFAHTGAKPGNSSVFALPIPIKVASGTRIAVRVSDSIANADNYQVGISYYLGL